MKVLIYGVFSIEVRRKIENFLCDDCSIIGYSDSFLKKDVLDNKNFINPGEIKNSGADYIVLSVNDYKTAISIKTNLVKTGIDPSSIIIPRLLMDSSFCYQKDLVNEIDETDLSKKSVLIFGLSYSLRGIIKDLLCVDSFDYSWHGLDLYYNLKLLEYSSNVHLLNNKLAILCFPYYYFNYDMSAAQYQYDSGQILSISRLDDYHNADYQNTNVKNHIVSFQLFSDRFMKYYNARENCFVFNKIDQATKREQPTHVWSKMHIETIEENKVLFGLFIKKLKKISNTERIIVVVPPFFLNGIKYLHDIYKMRELFYDIIGKYDIPVYDYIDICDDPCMFSDATHLNYRGAMMFTNMISELIANI